MRSIRRIAMASMVPAVLLVAAVLERVPTGNAATEMANAAEAFLAALSADQREAARFAFEDDERLNWHFVPRQRRGLPLRDMDERQ